MKFAIRARPPRDRFVDLAVRGRRTGLRRLLTELYGRRTDLAELAAMCVGVVRLQRSPQRGAALLADVLFNGIARNWPLANAAVRPTRPPLQRRVRVAMVAGLAAGMIAVLLSSPARLEPATAPVASHWVAGDGSRATYRITEPGGDRILDTQGLSSQLTLEPQGSRLVARHLVLRTVVLYHGQSRITSFDADPISLPSSPPASLLDVSSPGQLSYDGMTRPATSHLRLRIARREIEVAASVPVDASGEVDFDVHLKPAPAPA